MSVSKWRYTSACDGQPCPGDCDMCDRETDEFGKWIPVKDRLPDSPGLYLVTVHLWDGRKPVGVTTGASNWHAGEWLTYGMDDVIAWAPMPEPYKLEA